MKVLVACEFSGTVRDAFIRQGHDAISCDFLDTESPGPHIKGDVLNLLYNNGKPTDFLKELDLVIAHPPCTYLANSGVRWLYGGKGKVRDEIRWQQMEESARFFSTFLNLPVPVAVENPIMHKYAKEIIGSGPTQIIQPWQFGHPESKATCLWLKGLPLLKPTKILPMPKNGRWQNQTPSGQNKLGPSENRWRLRSATYSGIAEAMASQWAK